MTGGTSTGIERCETVGEIGPIRGKRIRSNDGRDRQPPEKPEADYAGTNGSKENSSQHSPIRHPVHQPELVWLHFDPQASMKFQAFNAFSGINPEGRCFEAHTSFVVNR
jgi:hypothetical protein